MKITSITPQQRTEGRYSVYVDGEFALGVGEDELVRLGLYTGQELTGDQLERARAEAEFSKAYQRVVNYISIRPRSEREITDYMRRKSYSVETARAVLDKVKRLQLVDDQAFARSWVEWRQSTTPRSRYQLQQELGQKGVDEETIEEALSGIDENEQVHVARALIDKKGHRYSSRQKLMSYLSRQGFTYDTIQKALDEEAE
ncbi:hypothetical protein BRC21_00370 [Candidatus Saccharibacteria bacterium SW_7_54_9]|nr:MAG: hypothetical protein BRC21_00370 [Candidatus Saccharibacteria bacterium SW_7_54_9]